MAQHQMLVTSFFLKAFVSISNTAIDVELEFVFTAVFDKFFKGLVVERVDEVIDFEKRLKGSFRMFSRC